MIKLEVNDNRAILDMHNETLENVCDDVFTILRVLYNIFSERDKEELFYQTVTYFMNNVDKFELRPTNSKLAAIIDEILKANGEK